MSPGRTGMETHSGRPEGEARADTRIRAAEPLQGQAAEGALTAAENPEALHLQFQGMEGAEEARPLEQERMEGILALEAAAAATAREEEAVTAPLPEETEARGSPS